MGPLRGRRAQVERHGSGEVAAADWYEVFAWVKGKAAVVGHTPPPHVGGV